MCRFRDAELSDFSRFPAVSDTDSGDYLISFFTDSRHGRYFGDSFVSGPYDLRALFLFAIDLELVK